MDAHNGGLEAQNGGLEAPKWSPRVSVDKWPQIAITLMKSRIRIEIRIEVTSWIRIRIKMMRIRNPSLRKEARK